MIKNIIDKLIMKKSQLQNCKDNSDVIKVNFMEEYNFYKIEISDYISIFDYVNWKKANDKCHVLDLLCNSVLWNNEKQMVNKGTYFVINTNKCLYNILFTLEKIIIDERMSVSLDEHTGRENITKERVLTYNATTNEYNCYSAKHEADGNTYYTRYYDKNSKYDLMSLNLTQEEAFYEVNSVICNLEDINGIEKVISVELLKEHVLNDLRKDTLQRKKI